MPYSHQGPLYDLRDGAGNWAGAISATELPGADVEKAVYLKGPAGSVTVHHCCAVHGSAPNLSPRVRPLLLQTYVAGDSFPLQTVGTNGIGKYSNTLVRGSRPASIEIGGKCLPVAPDWSGGYVSIFEVQQK